MNVHVVCTMYNACKYVTVTLWNRNVQIDAVVHFLVKVEVQGGYYEIPSSLSVHLGLEELLDQTLVWLAVLVFSLFSL